ncbi:hypothetical protein F5887DRAFT_1284197 [Amanita rubescens]|nr:hypothetical protein F5887DRAFT_1284197 [Amanita rubescens]
MSATRVIAFNEVAAKINTIHAKFKKEEQQGMSIRRKVYWNCLYTTNVWRTAHVVPVPVVPMGIENPDDNALNATVTYQLDGKTWIKPPPIVQDASGDADLIATHLGPKYVVPPALATSSKDIAGTSRTNGKRVFRSRDDHPATTRSADSVKPIVPGAYYDPHLLPDFGGPAFRLVNAKLLQREIMYDKLRPGTLVLMKVQLLTFELPDRQKSGLRKTYQFLIDRIRVVAHSEGEMEMPDNGNPGFSSRRSQLAERDETDDALDALSHLTSHLASAESTQIVETPSTNPNTRKETKTRSGKGKGKATAGSNDEEGNDTSDIVMTEN